MENIWNRRLLLVATTVLPILFIIWFLSFLFAGQSFTITTPKLLPHVTQSDQMPLEIEFSAISQITVSGPAFAAQTFDRPRSPLRMSAPLQPGQNFIGIEYIDSRGHTVRYQIEGLRLNPQEWQSYQSQGELPEAYDFERSFQESMQLKMPLAFQCAQTEARETFQKQGHVSFKPTSVEKSVQITQNFRYEVRGDLQLKNSTGKTTDHGFTCQVKLKEGLADCFARCALDQGFWRGY